MDLLVDFKLLHSDAIMPKYAHDGDSGMDLHALTCCRLDPVRIWTQTNGFEYEGHFPMLQCTGVALAIPLGWEAQVRPRSGLSAKGIYCALGTIDNSYRGEIKVCLTNLSGVPYEIKKGDRIAQLVFAPVGQASLRQVQELGQTERGDRGFGSSGQ